MAPRKTDPDRLVAIAGALLDEGGAPAVTMRAVGERAGVSAMAIYRHFADREALVGAVVDAAFMRLATKFESVTGSPRERLVGMVVPLVDVALEQPHLFAQMFTDPRPGARVLPAGAGESPTLRHVIAALADARSDGDVAADVDLTEAAVTCAALVQGLCLARYAGRIGGSDQEFRALVDGASRRLLQGLASPL